MSIWDSYPLTYRSREVHQLLETIRSGNCAWVVGLSGSGKSNLAGFFANRVESEIHPVLVDLNRLTGHSTGDFYHLVRSCLKDSRKVEEEYTALDELIEAQLNGTQAPLCLIIDRFENLPLEQTDLIYANLRSLRDSHKYQLTYLITSRQAPDPQNELSELFFGHILWLGPLSEEDALWSARQYAIRNHDQWDATQLQILLEACGNYASMLRAVCEAAHSGCPIEMTALRSHAIVRRRAEEFISTHPSAEDLLKSGLKGHPILDPAHAASPADLTAREASLMAYFEAHPQAVSEKDDLIKAVWPEDRVYLTGIRDDSLAQLVRRLRIKVEPDPSNPQHILTIPGRGYRFKP